VPEQEPGPQERVPGRAQLPVERGVGRLALGLQVDEQLERWAARVDAAAVRQHPLAQRLQVERAKRAGRVQVLRVVCDQQLAVDQEDVRLDAREPVGQRVEQGTVVLVVVVGVGLRERSHPRRRGGRRR
jgi:hypothetical protein